MKKFFLLATLFLCLAILFFGYGIYRGELQAGIILIFPFFVGSGLYALLGTIFLMFAIFSFALALLKRFVDFGEQRQEKWRAEGVESEMDGIVLIGPFPVIFSTKRAHIRYLAIIALALAIAIFLLFVFLIFF